MARGGAKRKQKKRSKREPQLQTRPRAATSHLIGKPPQDRVVEVGPTQRAEPVVIGHSSAEREDIVIGDAPGESIAIPTIALRSIAAVAREEELENLLTPEQEGWLDPEQRHVLSAMRRVFNEDGSEFVRAHVRLRGRDGGERNDVLDLPTRYVGMLLDASVRKPDPPPTQPPIMHRWKAKKPTWMGSYSFDKVWQHASLVADDAARAGSEVSPRGLQAISAIRMMGHKSAHLVRVDREQVEVLPDWEGMANLWDYVQDLQLPFDIVYLDFEGPGGFAPVYHAELDWEKNPQPGDPDRLPKDVKVIQIRGALLWRDPNGRLVCSLIAWPTNWNIGSLVSGEVPWSDYEIAGTVIFGGAGPFDSVLNEIGETEVTIGDDEFSSRPLGISTALITRGNLPGFVQLPIDSLTIARLRHKLKDSEALGTEHGVHALAAGWGAMMLASAARALAALSILEAQEVEIVDAPIETRDRKRAIKRGWNIAKMVVVRPSKKYLNAPAPTGEEARYSHRFWVRAHVKHFPIGTRLADSRPDLCKPCHRCGSCRRVPTPAFIKGPPDRPLVPKSLVIRRNEKVPVTLPNAS